MPVPTLIPGLTNVLNVFSSPEASTTLVQTYDGTVYAWGRSFRYVVSSYSHCRNKPEVIEELCKVPIRNASVGHGNTVIVIDTSSIQTIKRDVFIDIDIHVG